MGVALNWHGDTLDDTIELIEESYGLAQEAGDGALLLRCYNNLPMFRFEHGDELGPILELAQQGMRQARREAEAEVVQGPAHTIAWVLAEMGRPEEARDDVDEAVAAATSRGLSIWPSLKMRAMIDRLRGDTEAARNDEAITAEHAGEHRPMTLAVGLLGRAYASWPGDPAAALEELARAVDADGPWPKTMSALDVIRECARMALRLGDEGLLRHAVEQRRRWPGAPALEALCAAVDGLTADDEGRATEASAARLEELRHLRWALEAWTDAALMAARVGRDSEALERALHITERTGLQSLLGPLPETCWIRSSQASSS